MHLFFAALLTLSQTQRIDAIVARVMRDSAIPGVSLAIARGDAPPLLRGYGMRDAARGLRADGFTVYRVGSITKQFTAALVMRAVAEGKLPRGPDLVAELAQIAGPPGEDRWQYDNRNYAKLAQTLESSTGKSYATLLREQIVSPLGLFSTGYGDPWRAQNLALGNGTGAPGAPEIAGALYSNARDLTAWLAALSSQRVIPQTYFEEMTASARLSDGTPVNYGYGFFVDRWYGHRVAFHSGYVPGFSSEDAIVLDDRLALAVLTNRDAFDPTPLVKSIVAIVEPATDANFVAQIGAPPQNENQRVSQALKAMLQAPPFAQLGALVSLEFVERTQKADLTYDRYRARFDTGQWWLTAGYGGDGIVRSLNFVPAK